MKQIIIAVLFSIASLMAQANTEAINKELTQYHWYQAVSRIEQNPHNVRSTVAAFLENKKLYQAHDTQYCVDKTSRDHNAETDICYIGQPKQNQELLRVLRTKKVRNILSVASPWLIENGQDGKLNRGKAYLEFVEKQCKEGFKPSCADIPQAREWAKKISSLRK